MKITRKTTADKLSDYLYGNITQAELVDWAERAMMDADFDPADSEWSPREAVRHGPKPDGERGIRTSQLLADIIGRLGLADVAEFGLRWEDCEDFLRRLGYRATVTVSAE